MPDKLNDAVEDARETAVRTLRDVMVRLSVCGLRNSWGWREDGEGISSYSDPYESR